MAVRAALGRAGLAPSPTYHGIYLQARIDRFALKGKQPEDVFVHLPKRRAGQNGCGVTMRVISGHLLVQAWISRSDGRSIVGRYLRID